MSLPDTGHGSKSIIVHLRQTNVGADRENSEQKVKHSCTFVVVPCFAL